MSRHAATILMLLCLAAGTGAADERPAPERLEALEARIEALARAHREQRRERDAARAELAEAETAIGELNRRLRTLAQRTDAAEQRLETLDERAETLAARIAEQRRSLAAQLRGAYTAGRQPVLRILLGGESPGELSRMLEYARRLSAHQGRALENLAREQAALAELRTEQAETTRRLARLERETRERRASLADQRDRRAALVARLDARVADQAEELEQLRADQEELEALVASIDRAVADEAARARPETPFPRLKGELQPPLEGAIRRNFGERLGGGLRSRGWLIDAGRGDPVRAVADGRVVFADWLNGMGLLLIVDHGDGYMSLYGHNDSLFADVGEQVVAGEPVAAAGRSGGLGDSGLYFEIRHQGEPVDPRQWCRR